LDQDLTLCTQRLALASLEVYNEPIDPQPVVP